MRKWLTISLGLAVLTGLLTAVGSATATTTAYYRFEEGSGSTMLDSATGANNGTHSGSYSTWVPADPIPLTGASNQYGLSLNGSASATVGSGMFVFHSPGDATLEFYLKVQNQDHHTLFWTRTDNDDWNRYNISINPGGVLRLDYRDYRGHGDDYIHDILKGDAFAVPLDTWAHVAIVRTHDNNSGSDTYGFYLNGTFVTSRIDATPYLPTSLGWMISGRSGYEMTGLIDELRFSSSALTPDRFLDAPNPVPLPGGLLLFVPGLLGLFAFRKRAPRR